eukprot:3123482-Prymnesium_polylepis.1
MRGAYAVKLGRIPGTRLTACPLGCRAAPCVSFRFAPGSALCFLQTVPERPPAHALPVPPLAARCPKRGRSVRPDAQFDCSSSAGWVAPSEGSQDAQFRKDGELAQLINGKDELHTHSRLPSKPPRKR